jgi:hypothetical protein
MSRHHPFRVKHSLAFHFCSPLVVRSDRVWVKLVGCGSPFLQMLENIVPFRYIVDTVKKWIYLMCPNEALNLVQCCKIG